MLLLKKTELELHLGFGGEIIEDNKVFFLIHGPVVTILT